MQKKKSFLLLALAAPLALFGVIEKYRVSEPVSYPLPAMSDSTNLQGKKFAPGNMLSQKGKVEIEKLNPSAVTTDTTGLVALSAKGDGSVTLQMLETKIRADKYMTGSLKVTSPGAFEVAVDGSVLNTKTEITDSVGPQSTVSVPLILQPSMTHDIVITTLVTAPADIKAEFVPDESFAEAAYTIDPMLKKYVSLETTEMGCTVGGMHISPDGNYLLVNMNDKRDAKHRRNYADLYDLRTRRLVQGNLESGLRWMPRGSKLYKTVESDGAYDIYTFELPSMKQTKMVEAFPESYFDWAPDESYIIYQKLESDKVQEGPLRRYRLPDDRIPGNRDRYTIMKYDVKTGVAVPLVYAKELTGLMDISRDSRKILYFSSVQDPAQYPFYFTDVISMDLSTLRTDTIIAHEGAFTSGSFSPDGKQLLVKGGPSYGGGVGLALPEGVLPNDYDNQLFLVDVATGKATPCTRDFDPSVMGEPVWNAADGQIYFRADHGFQVELYTMNPKTLKITQLPVDIASVNLFSMGENEKQWIAYAGGDFNEIRRPFLLNLSTLKSTPLPYPFGEELARTEFGKVEPFVFTASDGTEIDGRAVFPPNYDPAKKYPLIVYYYGGTSPTEARLSTPYAPQLFASRGYIVYVLNPSGTTGYGQEFSARHVNAWGKRTSDDIIEGVQAFLKKYPAANAEKIGCIGASYGGFMTQYLLTQTDLFAAAVSHAGISNITSYWGEGYWGYSYNTVAASKSYPWNNPDLFTKQGSLFNADKIHTPLLLLHGTADTNVPIGESIQLFNALKILDRPVEFVTVDGEDHIIMDYDKRSKWHDAYMAWFAKWLQDSPEWWDSMFGDK